MSRRVVLVNYGVGNLLSVSRALAACGGDVVVSGEPKAVERADRLVVPGVGAFGSCMEALAAHGLLDAVKEFAAGSRPYLGICVGMQMLLENSEEFGRHDGLGAIAGQVVPVPRTGAAGTPHKIPHIGWGPLQRADGADWTGTILGDVDEGDAVYFVHSFMAEPADPEMRVADTDYDGRAISAVIGRAPVFGCQFHPEKSGPVGLAILRRFLAL
jgi:glutamine amidotransferase